MIDDDFLTWGWRFPIEMFSISKNFQNQIMILDHLFLREINNKVVVIIFDILSSICLENI